MDRTTLQPATISQGAHIFLVAAEESGDRLGAALIRAVRDRAGRAVRFSGIGGQEMLQEGIASQFPIDDLSIIGFSQIPLRVPLILRRIREASNAIIAARPSALVIIDSPDFTHRVARKVRAADPSIPIVDYVSPSVWAWRPGRAGAMRRYIDHVLALLPFEPEVHRRLGGPPCTFVGHPLAERVGKLRPNAEEARRRMAEPPIVLMLPGSRRSEIRRLLPVFADAIVRVQSAIGACDIVLPTVPHLRDAVASATAAWARQPRIVVDLAEKEAAFRVARAAIAKSGTVTLELALAGVPMITAYKLGWIEAGIARRLVTVPSIILANLVIGENVVPEFLQENCTAEKMAAALTPLLNESPERRRQVEAFGRLDEIMQIGRHEPAARAADIVLDLMRKSEMQFAGKAPNL
jgi:lipid-A-disaccharide synthase